MIQIWCDEYVQQTTHSMIQIWCDEYVQQRTHSMIQIWCNELMLTFFFSCFLHVDSSYSSASEFEGKKKTGFIRYRLAVTLTGKSESYSKLI